MFAGLIFYTEKVFVVVFFEADVIFPFHIKREYFMLNKMQGRIEGCSHHPVMAAAVFYEKIANFFVMLCVFFFQSV